MELVTVNIPVSLEVEERLKALAAQKGDGIDYMQVAIQCIEVAHKIQTHWRARRYIYEERQPLTFPAPKDCHQVEMHQLRLRINKYEKLSLDELCNRHQVDQQSVLVWAMDCMRIIDDKLMTCRLFSGLTQPHELLTFGWLHHSQQTG